MPIGTEAVFISFDGISFYKYLWKVGDVKIDQIVFYDRCNKPS